MGIVKDISGQKFGLLTPIEFCEDLNIDYTLVWHRLDKGWSIDMALETKPVVGSNQTLFKPKSNFISYSFGHINA